MRISFTKFWRDQNGMAGMELMFISITVALIFYLGLNFTYLVREFDELRDTGRMAAWLYQENGEEFGNTACRAANLNFVDPASGEPFGTRFVDCDARNRLPQEEKVALVPFWTDAKNAVGMGSFEEGLVDHVKPEPLRLLVSNARQFQSSSASALGRAFIYEDDMHAVTDWVRWTHDDQPLDKGYDQHIVDELRQQGTHRHGTQALFPNLFTKAR